MKLVSANLICRTLCNVFDAFYFFILAQLRDLTAQETEWGLFLSWQLQPSMAMPQSLMSWLTPGLTPALFIVTKLYNSLLRICYKTMRGLLLSAIIHLKFFSWLSNISSCGINNLTSLKLKDIGWINFEILKLCFL